MAAKKTFKPGFSANVLRKDGGIVHITNYEDMPKDLADGQEQKLTDAGAFDVGLSFDDAIEEFMPTIVAQGSEDPALREDVAIEAGRGRRRTPAVIPDVDAGALATAPSLPAPPVA